MTKIAPDSKEGTVIQIVKIKSNLPHEELMKRAREREPQFRAIPGLIQKYYTKSSTSEEYRGIYIWDSAESLKAFKASDLAKSIPLAYEVTETPNVEIADILFKLRE